LVDLVFVCLVYGV